MESLGLSQKGINGEGKLRGQPANQGSPWKKMCLLSDVSAASDWHQLAIGRCSKRASTDRQCQSDAALTSRTVDARFVLWQIFSSSLLFHFIPYADDNRFMDVFLCLPLAHWPSLFGGQRDGFRYLVTPKNSRSMVALFDSGRLTAPDYKIKQCSRYG